MIKVQTLSLRGLCIATLLVFAACSGAPSTEGDTPTGPSQPSTTAPRANPQGQGQGVSHERNLQLVSDAVNKARRSLELRLFEDAQREAAFALELDNGNEEARRILNQCNEVLGDKVARAINQEGDAVLRNRIAAERERALVRNELQLGNANFDLGAFGRAIENYEKALAYLNFSQHFPPNDPLRKEAEERLDSATKAKAEADKAQGRSLQAASQADLDREARDLAAAKATMVERYLQDANVKFQSGDYKEAVDRVQQALLQDPTNPTALALRDLADRARHETSLELHRERWKQDWITTFNELQQSNLPQTDVVKFDPARWAEVSQRAPATYTQPSELDTPEVKQIQKKLDETVLEHNFSSATVDAWAHYYSSVTSVTFFVMDDVKAMAPESTTLNDFKLPRMSVTQALKVIQSQTGVAWRIKNGMVQLVSPANAIGTLYLSRHRVADLVLGVKGHPGPELKLASPGDDSPLFPEDTTDPVPSVVDDGRLRELIQSTVAEGKWENNPFSLNYQAGVLLIRADAETHEKVARLLNDLRRHVGIQVDVEARFLKVEDNFLEDVGIDLRGLGNQASQGQAGQGLGARPNVGFDDFGPKQQQNAATPGTVGTGTEPGVFFDNGRDGDVMGRVENLYDQTLGGHNGSLTNNGGLALQYAYLGDTEYEIILRAVAKQERSEQIDAPRLLIYNNTRASMSFLRSIAYIRDFDVEIAQAAAVANPIIGTVHDGVALDVRPVVDADLRFITLELRPTLMTLSLPIPTFTTTLGVGQPISIQLPNVTLQRVRTTVTMPDGGTMMLGGMKLVEKQVLTSGVPVLKDLPGLSFLFSRKGSSTLNRKILILIRAKIILMEEQEPTNISLPDGTVLTSSR